MKITRLTRHAASDDQLNELTRIFGDAEVSTVSETLPSDSREAVARFDEVVAGSVVAEVVLPPNLLEAILKFSDFSKGGGTVVRAVTNRTLGDDGNVSFEFSHYERVLEVKVVTEPL